MKKLKKQQGKIKSNEIQTRLDFLRCSRKIKYDKNNNYFPPNNSPDILPSFPPDFPFNPPSSLDSPSFPSAPPFPSFPPPSPFAPLTSYASPLPDYDTAFAQKIALVDSDLKIRTPQKLKIILTQKVEEIPQAEEKIRLYDPLNQLFPEPKRIFDDEKTNEEPKTESPLPKYNEII